MKRYAVNKEEIKTMRPVEIDIKPVEIAVSKEPKASIVKKIQPLVQKNNRYSKLIKSRCFPKQTRPSRSTPNDFNLPVQVDLGGWSITSVERL